MLQEKPFEVVEPAKGYRLDGAPASYRQLYGDDVGPFVFPIPGEFTKKLTAPGGPFQVFRNNYFSALSWLISFGFLAVRFDSMLLFVVASVGFFIRLINSLKIFFHQLDHELSLAVPQPASDI